MERWFGDISSSGPVEFLVTRGYLFSTAGEIVPPVPSKQPTPEEGFCISFLCDEWDYGWEDHWSERC